MAGKSSRRGRGSQTRPGSDFTQATFGGWREAGAAFAHRVLPLWDMQEHRRTPVVTTGLLAINLLVFLFEVALSLRGERLLETFILSHGLVPVRWLENWNQGEGWTPVATSMFLHGGIAHLLGNVWFLWVFGRTLEQRLGSVRFGLLYVVAGVTAALAQVATNPQSAVPMIGASGAISGVLGGYFRLLPRAWVWTLVPWFVPLVPLPAVVFLVMWFGLQMVNGLGALLSETPAAGGVAWWAHAGGFVAGLALAGALSGRPRRRRGRRSN